MRHRTVEQLKEHARLLPRDVVTMVHLAGDGHPGPALSVVDLVAAFYFYILRIDSAHPEWPDRDRCLLSKGHSCPAVYSALAWRGFFPREVLSTLRRLGSILQGHPEMRRTPGIDMTTGSLGHGLPIGTGMAAAGRFFGKRLPGVRHCRRRRTERGHLLGSSPAGRASAARPLDGLRRGDTQARGSPCEGTLLPAAPLGLLPVRMADDYREECRRRSQDWSFGSGAT